MQNNIPVDKDKDKCIRAIDRPHYLEIIKISLLKHYKNK
jgi:hypothetical protein